MRSGPILSLQAVPYPFQRALPGIAVCLALSAFCAQPAFAQAPASAQAPAATNPGVTAEGEREIAFEANELSHDQDSDTVSAKGDVLLQSGDQSVRADAVTWDRKTGQIIATGSIRFVDEDGNQLFTDRLELTDELKTGAMDNLLLAFREGGRLAARRGTRDESGNAQLDNAVYSACPVEDENGCEQSPSWRITAERVVFDAAAKRIRFRNAHFELFGMPILPLPGLSLRSDGGADSGFLVPDVGISTSNGIELSSSYYWRLAPNQDLELTGHVFTAAKPMVSGLFRHLGSNGAFQISGYLTHGARVALDSETGDENNAFRGYFAANGKWQLDPHWSVTASARVASDRTFLRRYDISRDDRMRSTVNVERIDENSYLSIAGWATQLLLVQDDQGTVPVALPVLDYRRRLAEPVMGGTVELRANTLAITRTEGQDTQRAFASGKWEMRRYTPMGQEITATALVRADIYHSSDNLLTTTAAYRGEAGWQGRAVALGAVDVKWPFVGSFLEGTQVLTPRVQFVASPPIRNFSIPNEDSRAFDLEDSNIFALNRFPGHDRVEDGARVTYGFDWQAEFPGWRLKTTLGQSYRLTDKANLFPDGSGLNEQFSDFVGRTEVRFGDFVKFTHRYRLDKDNFAVRRNEFDAAVGSDKTYAEIGYLRLNRDVDLSFEDLQDREELRAAGRIAFAKHWSVFGSAVVNLTDRNEDPSFTSDGFDPLRTRLGFAYADDCLEFGFVWRRDYVELADARKGNGFSLYFNLRNISFR